MLRRVVIKHGEHAYYMLLGVENQTFVDYGMLLGVLHYDIVPYMLQKHATKGKKYEIGKPFTAQKGYLRGRAQGKAEIVLKRLWHKTHPRSVPTAQPSENSQLPYV